MYNLLVFKQTQNKRKTNTRHFPRYRLLISVTWIRIRIMGDPSWIRIRKKNANPDLGDYHRRKIANKS